MMYILAVALEDGTWDYVTSYLPERAHRPATIALWKKISAVEDPAWTKRYFDPDPANKTTGGRIEVTMNDGTVIADEIVNADASNYGATPCKRDDFLQKCHSLAVGLSRTYRGVTLQHHLGESLERAAQVALARRRQAGEAMTDFEDGWVMGEYPDGHVERLASIDTFRAENFPIKR